MKDVVFTTLVGGTVVLLLVIAVGAHKSPSKSVTGTVGGILLCLAGYSLGRLLELLAATL